jgi:hypothetical protein
LFEVYHNEKIPQSGIFCFMLVLVPLLLLALRRLPELPLAQVLLLLSLRLLLPPLPFWR